MTPRSQAQEIVDEFMRDYWGPFKASMKGRSVDDGALVWGHVCNAIQRHVYDESVRAMRSRNRVEG